MHNSSCFYLALVPMLSLLLSCNKEYNNECPLLFIDGIESENLDEFAFVGVVEGDLQDAKFQWYLDDMPVTIIDGENGSSKDNIFRPQNLSQGRHTVNLSFKSAKCPQSRISKTEFEVANYNSACENIFFTYERA